jgi:hypothetical protein
MSTCHHDTQSQALTPMKTYTVLFAEDIPHYGSTDIEAADDTHALAIAESLDMIGLYYEGSWDGAVCKRIVSIEDSSGVAIANDIPLDNYFLRNGGQADRSLCEAAPDLLEVVRYTTQVLSDFTPDALRNLGLDALFEKACSAVTKATPN